MPEKMILTEEEEKKICDLYQSGMGFRKIFREYGYGQSVAVKVLRRHGVTIRDRLQAGAEYREKKKAECVKERGTLLENPNQPPIDCDMQGGKCLYKRKFAGTFACEYCLEIGHSRGCDPKECTKYRFLQKEREK